jgi:hypothetical protein
MLSQLHVKEATGKNDGKEVEEYLRTAGGLKGWAWCVAFPVWVYTHCGVPCPKTCYTPSFFTKDLIYQRGKGYTATPRCADAFSIYFPNMGRDAHTGMIYRWPPGDFFISVEGNTSEDNYGQKTREGNGVFKKKRLKRQCSKIRRFIW